MLVLYACGYNCEYVLLIWLFLPLIYKICKNGKSRSETTFVILKILITKKAPTPAELGAPTY